MEAETSLVQHEAVRPVLSKFAILRNVCVVSVVFLFLFTSFQSFQNLQSTLNKEEGLGPITLAILYFSLIVSSLFLPSFLIAKFGCKWTLSFSILCYVVYMLANFWPMWATLVPASVVIGIGAAPLWSAKSTYLSQLAKAYAGLTDRTGDDVNNLFFGIFFMTFQTSQIWGNIISSSIFKQNIEEAEILNSSSLLCGASFNPSQSIETIGLKRPDDNKVQLLCWIYFGSSMLAFVIALFVTNTASDSQQDPGTSHGILFIETFRHLCSSGYQKLLIPLTVYSGLEQGFISADYTKSYISCTIGIWNIGYVMICYGVTDAILSLTFGALVKWVGHTPFFVLEDLAFDRIFNAVFLIAFIVHGGTQIFLLLWEPNNADYVIFFVIAGLWGMGDAVIQTQINALYGDLFEDRRPAAFSNYRLWESVGFIISFAYNSFFVTSVKIYVLMAFLTVGMTLYCVIEINRYLERRRNAVV
ncbi:hypothetical protein FSP39_001180 [Pinctada imbricata]|uniref:UNC93-like protein n=1 Tax=Pinctada imbricata TaxID=66713 RepID=A0AA88XGS8_PINIB|nr:hypothetical protein FSP39_001180 [Pinctada imbricata]